MSGTVRVMALVALVALGGVKAGVVYLSPGDNPATPPTPAVTAPSVELQTLVQPIKAKLAGQLKAAQVAGCYRAWADVIQRDAGSIVSDTRVFERGHRAVLVLHGFDRDPAVGAEIDLAIGQYLGLQRDAEGWVPAKLDAPLVARLVDVLKAISWAGEG